MLKEMYRLAREGNISNFTGLTDPYETPNGPDITVNTEKNNH